VKPDHVDPLTALNGAAKILGLPITATSASTSRQASGEKYVVKGSKGAQDDPKVELVYFHTAEKTLALTWRVETNLKDKWLLSYTDAKTAAKVHGVGMKYLDYDIKQQANVQISELCIRCIV
jgi:extracellular elastinolytic metalloproteinase